VGIKVRNPSGKWPLPLWMRLASLATRQKARQASVSLQSKQARAGVLPVGKAERRGQEGSQTAKPRGKVRRVTSRQSQQGKARTATSRQVAGLASASRQVPG
ncbi:unnamed protein product, partial [Ilex paraguariensis]